MKTILTQAEMDHLADVIGEVETKTAGEIRLMIVSRSAVSGHVQPLLWAALVAITFLAIWFGRHDLVLIERWWLWPSLLVFHFFLALALAHLNTVQRLLTSVHDLHHQVWARAEVEFHREGLSDSSKHTGVLIFLSRMERMAVVLADQAIAEKTEAHAWDKVIGLVIAGAKSGQWAKQLEAALRECGVYLADHFPPQAGQKNELPNTVIVKD